MAKDGEIDYRSRSRAQLIEALNNIDGTRYPINYANLRRELDSRPPEPDRCAPHVVVVSMRRYVLFAFGGMITALILSALADAFLGIRAGPAPFGAGVLASILVSAMLFLNKHRRPLGAMELRNFFVGCFISFWFVDQLMLLPLKFPIAVEQHGMLRASETAIAGSLVDLALVAVAVYGVVPWMSRFAIRKFAT